MKLLLFAFVKEFRRLKNVGFNFTPNIRFHYNPSSRRLSMSEEENVPVGFFGERIYSITAVAGKNGIGKSSLLRWLLDRAVEGAAPDSLGGIMIYKEKDERIKIYHDVEITNTSDFPNLSFIDLHGRSDVDSRFRLAIPTFYCADSFEPFTGMNTTSSEYHGEVNLSDKFLLIHDLTRYKNIDSIHLHNPIREYLNAYFLQNNVRICTLLLDPTFHDTFGNDLNTSLNLPRYILFRPNTSADEMIRSNLEHLYNIRATSDPDESSSSRNNQISFFEKINGVPFNSDMEAKDEEEGKKGLARFLYTSLKSILYNLRNFPDVLDQSLGFIDFLLDLFTDDYKHSTLGSLQWIIHAIHRIEDKLRAVYDVVHHFLAPYYGLRETLEVLSRDCSWHDGQPYLDCGEEGNGEYANRFPTLPAGRRLVDLMNSKNFLVERYFDPIYSHWLTCQTPLSAGEMAMLNLYSRIKFAFDNPHNGGAANIPTLLLLDEVENTFHPEWQRQFIKRLTHFLGRVVPDGLKVQVVYTTHSPVTLSDMPRQCTQLLNTENEGQVTIMTPGLERESFGANVFDLYGDSFFMKNGLIGEFSKKKIEELAQEIENNNGIENGRGSLEKRIRMIGDERIRNYLNARLYRDNPNEEIRSLQRRITEIKARNQQEERRHNNNNNRQRDV